MDPPPNSLRTGSVLSGNTPPGRAPAGRAIWLARWTPYAVMALVMVAVIGFFGPQHRVKTTQIYVCWAPDCRSSVLRSTDICGGSERLHKKPLPDLLNLMIFGILGTLQILALTTRRRKLHLMAGIITLVGALGVMGVLSFHSAIGHLLNKTQSMWGEIFTHLAAGGLLGLGLTQLLVAISFSRQTVARK